MAAVVALAALLATSGCATPAGPRTYEVSLAQLSALVARVFPLENRLLDVVELRIEAPRVTLSPGEDRVVAALEIEIGGLAFDAPHRGSVAIAFGLRYEPVDDTLRITRVRVDRLLLDAAAMPLDRRLARVSVRLAEQLLDDRVVHTLSHADIAALRDAGYRFGAIHVTPSGLAITWQPVRAR